MENQQHILDPLPPGEQPTPRKSPFLKGVVYAILYYASGLGLAALVYAIVGHPYIHAPGLHHWLIFLTFGGGFIWTLAASVKYFLGTRNGKLRGIMSGNVVAVLSFALWFYSVVYQDNGHLPEEQDEISMSQNGDTTILYYNDNIVYMKVRDSVFLNFIDCAKFHGFGDSQKLVAP